MSVDIIPIPLTFNGVNMTIEVHLRYTAQVNSIIERKKNRNVASTELPHYPLDLRSFDEAQMAPHAATYPSRWE